MIPDKIPTVPAEKILADALAMPDPDRSPMTMTEMRALAQSIRAQNPGVPIYFSSGIEDLPMMYRPITRDEWAVIMNPAIPAGPPTQRAMVAAALLYPSYESVMVECERRAHLLSSLTAEIARVSGQGPANTFVRWMAP